MAKSTKLLGVMALIGLITTACGSHSTLHNTSAPASHAHPNMIIPTPAGTLAATAPEPNGTLWVLAGNSTSRGIYNMDVSRKKTIGSISVSNNANVIAESSTGLVALGVSTPTSGAVQFRNGTTGAILHTVAVSGPITAIAAGSDGTSFYVLNGHSSAKAIAIVNGQTGKIESTVPAPSDAVSIIPTPGENGIYVLEPNGVVSEIATAGGHVTTQFPIGHSGRALAIGPNGHTLYVLKGQGVQRNVAIVNLATESVKSVLPAAADAVNITLSPDGQILYDVVGSPSYGNVQAFKL